ncbi:DinB family protein [Bacillus horti]|uniref:Damage-inducible protein DinB n=1 Tax=Caldalkalibacillus horti TaxID=77523 RepID=A0ABT9W5C6_9BACI|nr:DinB family protein [Bacillus horti]MDQ0168458.1 putative damage-inducible protein DinB [Bacillus horti]
MTHAKTVLLDQLLANANDRSWYLSFQEVADGVTDGEANWKPYSKGHSMAEIVQHLIYWNRVWQSRFEQSNVTAVQTLEDNADTFRIGKDRTFSELKKDLLDTLLSWQDLIISESSLDSKVQGFPEDAEWWAIIGNVATHNAYHIGQIAYLRKMQKHTIS